MSFYSFRWNHINKLNDSFSLMMAICHSYRFHITIIIIMIGIMQQMPKSTEKLVDVSAFHCVHINLLLLLLLISKLNYYKLVQHFTTECLYNQILNVNNNNEILKSRYKVTRECFENKLYVIRKYSRRPRRKYIYFTFMSIFICKHTKTPNTITINSTIECWFISFIFIIMCMSSSYSISTITLTINFHHRFLLRKREREEWERERDRWYVRTKFF